MLLWLINGARMGLTPRRGSLSTAAHLSYQSRGDYSFEVENIFTMAHTTTVTALVVRQRDCYHHQQQQQQQQQRYEEEIYTN